MDLWKVIWFVVKSFTDPQAEDVTSTSLEERRFRADQKHQQAERAREDKKLTVGYHIKAGVLGPFTAGACTVLGIVALQSFQGHNAISVEKRRFEGDIILNSLHAQKQGDAVANLQFALDIGLIPDYAIQVREKLQKDNRASIPFNPQPQVTQLQPQQPPKPDVFVPPSYKDAPEQYELQITTSSFSGVIPQGMTCDQYKARWDEARFSPDDKILSCLPGQWRGKPPYPPPGSPNSGVFFEEGKPPRRTERCEDSLRAWDLSMQGKIALIPGFKPPHVSKNPTCVPLDIHR